MYEPVNEMLEKIDKATGTKKEELLKEYGGKHPINMILSLNFDETIQLDVPEGMPPYKRDEATHPDLFPTSLSLQLKRLKSIMRGRHKMPKLQREAIFIQTLEAIPPKEADVLVFAKDHALTELYPTITGELVAKFFPAYIKKSQLQSKVA